MGCAVMAFAIKSAGPVVFGGRPLPERLRAVVFLVAAPLLAALVVTQALAEGDELKLDAESAGVAVAGLAGWVRVPVTLCLVLAAVVTGVLRALAILTSRHGCPQAQRPRPVAHLGGLVRLGGAAPVDRPGAAGRPVGLPPLLGGRAPRWADAGGPQPRGADRADRLRDRAHPGGQRRRDAAPLQPVQGGRELQRAGGAVPGADRPGAGPRVGHRPDDRARAAARPHATRCPTTSRTSWPS